MTKTKKTARPVAAKSTDKATAVGRKAYEKVFESDGTYLLKLIVFALLGTLWIKFQQPMIIAGILLNGVPAGLLIGLIIVHQFEKHQADRKIWYAILLVVTIISYFVPAGIVI